MNFDNINPNHTAASLTPHSAPVIVGAGYGNGASASAVNYPSTSKYHSLPRWLRWTLKTAVVLLAVSSMFLSFWGFLGGVACMFGSIFEIIGCMTILSLEAPVLLTFVRCIDSVRDFSNTRKAWHKVIVYTVCPVLALCLCQSAVICVASSFLLAITLVYFCLIFRR